MASLTKLPWACLTHLDLRACQLSATSAASLASAMQHGGGGGGLTLLDLSCNDLGPGAGVELGRMLESAGSLAELRLRGCGLGDEGVAGLARGLGAHAGLLALDLGDNQCGSGWVMQSSQKGSCHMIRIS